MIRICSLFDGSGGFPLAGVMCGMTPVYAAEVEPYPIAVTRSRFPDMIHLGDVSKVNGAELEPVDVVTFGSPCQDLSVAGKRAGLKHEDNGDDETTRSGLFMEAVRIIKEMREATNGLYPRFAVWENVPGAFSSNGGEDFRTVIEELIKIVEPTAIMPPVPKNGWAYADCYMGDGWSLAYRVFDAQYWGVPQRRRRIYLVTDFRGECAGKVLFEREGLRGHFATGGTPWEATPGNAQDCPGADDRVGETVGFLRQLGGVEAQTEISPTLMAAAGMSGNNKPCVAYTLKIRSGCEGGGKGALVQEDKSATLATNNDRYLFQPVAYSFDSMASNSMKSKNPHSGCREVNVAKTLDTTDPNPSKNQGGIAIVQPVPSVLLDDQGGSQMSVRTDGKAPTLRAEMHGNVPALVYCIGNGQTNQSVMSEKVGTLNCMHEQQGIVEVSGMDCRNGRLNGDLSGTLQAKPNGGFSHNFIHPVIVKTPGRYIVRRLTPTECARLQGFPDCWGHPERKNELADAELQFWTDVRNTHASINGKAAKEYTATQMLTWYNKLHTDSAEYKMWGNGIALPTALYVMQGIADALKEE